MVMSPSIDQWYDDSIEPVVVDTNTDLFNIFLVKESVKESFPLVYDNSFVINWVGASSSFTAINSLGNVNTQVANTSVQSDSVSSSNISPSNRQSWWITN